MLIKNFRIRYKLLFIYSTVFIVIISVGSTIIYSSVRKTVEINIESELKNSTAAILNMVRTSVSVSIKNHLRAVAERNYDIIQMLHKKVEQGKLSEREAFEETAAIILSQKIGSTGYVCILDDKGKVLIHPKKQLEGLDISNHEFVREMISKQNGYIEYSWQNPGETEPMPKALYVKRFKPWNWMITVSSYRKEFKELVNIDDFEDSVLSLKFGKTGYSYVLDTKGNTIIHPELRRVNIIKERGLSASFFNEMMEKKSGKIIYTWMNPNDEKPRKKLVIFNRIPEYEWIVASSSYLDEFYSPLKTLRNFISFIVMVSLVLFIPITFLLSSTITNPLRELKDRFQQDTMGDFSGRVVEKQSQDEVGQLTMYYNLFMNKLEQYSKKLQDEIHERKQAEEALRISEERYRTVMEATPDPIIVYDMNGFVTYLNPAFTKVFGWNLEESVGKKMDHFVPEETWEETCRGIDIIAKGENLPRTDTKRRSKSGQLIDVSIRGAVYKNQEGTLVGSVITHRDESEVKLLENKIMEVEEKERQKIGNDLHDDLCPHLIGIEGLIKVLKRKVKDKAPETVVLSDQITDLIKEAILKTRRLARGLCPVYFNRSFQSSLDELIANAKTLFRIECTLVSDGDILTDDNMVVSHLYYIAQESLHNAVKHGKASHVEIVLKNTGGIFQMRIKDDGIGISRAPKTDGMGLRIMKHRAKMISASFSIEPAGNRGTVVKLDLPVHS